MPRWIWERSSWPRFNWSEQEVALALSRARRAQGMALGALSVLESNLGLEAEFEVLVEDGLRTSAIEGERVDRAALRSSVARQLGLPWPGATKATRAVDGLVEVLLDATQNHARPVTLKRLLGWNAALFPTGYSGLSRIRAGKLRGLSPMRVVSGPLGKETTHFEAPPGSRVSAEMRVFIQWFRKNDPPLDGLVRAGIAHLWFVTIHPFEDGNGRIARALSDLVIAQDEGRKARAFSVSAQIAQSRNEYYDLLERTQKGDLDVTPWLVWFLAQVEAAALGSRTLIARTLGKARFWMRHREVPLTDRQRKALNRLLDAGPGGFEGGMTTRKYASLAKTSRATAYRELADLVEKGCFVPLGAGGGRSSAYDVRWEI